MSEACDERLNNVACIGRYTCMSRRFGYVTFSLTMRAPTNFKDICRRMSRTQGKHKQIVTKVLSLDQVQDASH